VIPAQQRRIVGSPPRTRREGSPDGSRCVHSGRHCDDRA
jgi:hypothetical protein